MMSAVGLRDRLTASRAPDRRLDANVYFRFDVFRIKYTFMPADEITPFYEYLESIEIGWLSIPEHQKIAWKNIGLFKKVH